MRRLRAAPPPGRALAVVHEPPEPARGRHRDDATRSLPPGPDSFAPSSTRFVPAEVDMFTSLQGASVVVVGGSSGIGFATARMASTSGAHVTIVGRDKD